MAEAITGWFVGVTQAIVGHPFDTWKLRIHIKQPVAVHKKKYFYGISAPILTNGLINASFFGIDHHFHDKYGHFIAGAIAGGLTSVIVCPIENWKINKQMEYKRPIRLYRGLPILAAREVSAIGIYFGLYNYLTETYQMHPLYAGGITGWVSWLSYPFDVIKNRVQSDYSITTRQAFERGDLMKGFGICSIRAVLVNSTGFWTYDLIFNLIKDNWTR